VRDIFSRIAVWLVLVVVACTGIAVSLGYFFFAIFAAFSSLMPPALAALATGFAILVATFLIVAIGTVWARGRRRPEQDTHATGRALGAMFSGKFRDFADENPRASTLMSLVAGFFSAVGR
jgi:hypothetical protein